MHLKMDAWQSEWTNEENSDTDFNINNPTQLDFMYNVVDNAVYSPNVSRDDSIESCEEEQADKNDCSLLKPTFKSVLQAKKRLQAFSAVKQLKRTASKDDKMEEGESSEKISPKKKKRGLYPDDKAKAVIQEIEEIKLKEFMVAKDEQVQRDIAITAAMKATISLQHVPRARSRSLSSERERFRRREIKSRNNYRRSDSFNRKSPSPGEHSKRSDRKSPMQKLVYPKNWTEYKQQNLTLVKDDELKLKVFPKVKYSQHELIARFINFVTPSPLIESFKSVSVEDKVENIPFSFLRVTRSKPSVTYSINAQKNKDSYITRKQLFQIIPRDRRDIIEKLINTPSRSQPRCKSLQTRQWYLKSWKKSADAECKVLENSVGLSFLQTYSDEEEDNETEEVVICSSTKENVAKKNAVRKIQTPEKKISNKLELQREEKLKNQKLNLLQDDTFTSNDTTIIAKQFETLGYEGNLTPEKKPAVVKNTQKDEIIETRKAIKELEEELERRKAINTEEESKDKPTRKKKKKKAKRKEESSDSEMQIETRKRKRKKKKKAKKRKLVEEDISCSENENRKKKRSKKSNLKIKSKKKKEKLKKEEPSGKEFKAKKKDEDTKESNYAEESKRKRKKSSNDEEHLHERNISTVEDNSSTIERKRRKEKKNNKKNKYMDKETEESENIIEDNIMGNMKKQSKNAEREYKTDKDSEKKGKKSNTVVRDSPYVEKDLFYGKEKTEKGSRKNSKDFDADFKCESKSNLEKDVNRKSDIELKSREKSLRNEKESKKVYKNDRSKIDVQIAEKEIKRTKEHTQKSHKHDDNTRKKNIVEDIKIKDAEYSKKSSEKLDKKQTEKEKQTGYRRRSGEKSEDRDKCEIVNRSRRSSRGSSENLDKHREGESAKNKHNEKSETFEKHQKERKHKEERSEKIDKERSEKIDKDCSEKIDKVRSEKIDKVRSEKIDKGRSEKKDKERSEKVDKERSEKVDKERSEKVDKERSEKVDKEHSEKVDKERSAKVDKERSAKVDKERSEKVDKERYEKVDKERFEKVDKVRSEKVDKELFEKIDSTLKEEPDWEKLRYKRNRHRNSDSKESNKDILETICLSEEIEAFPLEKEDYQLKEKEESKAPSTKSKEEHKQREIGTPDTDEYRENWEKDPFPIWESEDEAPPKPREKLNNSWESDEEIFERGHRIVATTRPFNDTFDLEIPLNIKPFKKREIIDSDKELQLLKRQSKTLSEERRQLEIEKLRVKELELKVIRETESIAKEDHHKPKRRRSQDEKSSKISVQDKEVVVKKGRWDKKVPQCKTSTPKAGIINLSRMKKENIDDDDSSTNVSSSTSLNNTSAVLENEYEEFMKAVTSSTSPKTRKEKMSKTKESNSSDSNFSISSDSESSHVKKQIIQNQNNKKQNRDNVINLEPQIETLVSPSNQTLTIVPKDVSLIPMPLPQTEIKPVPVPSPKIDLENIPKPLINLNLSTNITLDMASKITATFHSPVAKLLELAANPPPAPPIIIDSPVLQNLEVTAPVQKAKPETVSFASPLTDVSLDSVLFDEKSKDIERRLNDKPFVFTGMVLTSKRPLLNNSKLNLGDSDDEEDNAMKIKRLEEIKKEYLTDSAYIPVENTEVHIESAKEIISEVVEKCVLENKEGSAPKHSPSKRIDSRKTSSSEKIVKREASPKRVSHGRREPSPRRRNREPSPKRRRISPRRHSSPRRRSPLRRKSSPVKKRLSPRRSVSPKYRKRSISPKRIISPKRRILSPRRSISPRVRTSSPRRIISPRTRVTSPRRSISPRIQNRPSSPKDNRTKSPEKSTPNISVSLQENPFIDYHTRKSPAKSVITSPLEGLKRSVADSTISDDSLLQPAANIEEYTESPISRFYDRTAKTLDSPKRVPLDIRINQVLGLKEEPPKPITTTYASYNYKYNQYSQQLSGLIDQKSTLKPVPISSSQLKSYNTFDIQPLKSNFVQVGNMVRIVPTEDMPTMEVKKVPPPPPKVAPSPPVKVPKPPPVMHKKETSQIVQVGNMLQIVPADLPLVPPLPPEPKVEPPKESPSIVAPSIVPVQEVPKPSAETVMKLKVAERRAEREKRRQDREKRRKEKDKRRKEKEKQKQIKLKQRTENMIKKALQLEVEGALEDEEDMIVTEMPAQWPPLPIIVSSVSKEASKSILIRGSKRNESVRLDKPKIVQFADGVRPGEGTSPSGGEELSSPPPSKKLPKEKRFKKTKLLKKNQKKKVKVKVIKKCPETEESDEEDCLPPPSPPPGSPPPHLFPPRIKVHAINNIHPYIPNVVPIPTSQQLYRPPPQLNIIMHPHHHGPPPPPHHGPPHHHHGPPHHHHGPPPPPGPHFHHGPPPPPHHGPPPPPPHHGPPPPPPHHGPGPHL